MSDINNILDNIERSVLVIGPGIVLDKDGNSLQASFAERYSQRNKGLIRHYFAQDNIIRPKNAATRLTVQKNFADFYEKDFPEKVKELYRKISQIPYPLIISLNPDKTMVSCFDEYGCEHTFDFYIRGKKNLINEIPTTGKPYLFNLAGSYTDPESLILTYDDLFEYLRNILPGDALPTAIRTNLKNAVNITFLGVEFEKWYFQLLVKLLTEFDEKFELLRYAAPDLSSLENINSICANNFEITFVGPDVNNFINELYYHCYKHKDHSLRGEKDHTGVRLFNPEIFISYKHGGESEEVADKLFETGNAKGYNIVYDKANLEYKGRTWEFMQRIGWGRYVIIIISDGYLKSEYCMFEFMEIMSKAENLEDRSFPIVLPDADIFRELNRKKYDNYWKDEIEKLKTGLSEMGSDELLKRVAAIRKYEKIQKAIPKLMEFLDSRNSLTLQKLRDDHFNPIFMALDKKIEEDLSI
jgi:hypothetical protein